jgi:hypothetical protein
MTPNLRTPDAYREVAARLDRHPVVLSADVIDAPPHENSVVEVVLAANVERVPPALCRAIGDADFGIVDVSPRGNQSHKVVEVQ